MTPQQLADHLRRLPIYTYATTVEVEPGTVLVPSWLVEQAATALLQGSSHVSPIKGIESFIDEISDLSERSPLTPHGRDCVRTILLAFSAHVKHQQSVSPFCPTCGYRR